MKHFTTLSHSRIQFTPVGERQSLTLKIVCVQEHKYVLISVKKKHTQLFIGIKVHKKNIFQSDIRILDIFSYLTWCGELKCTDLNKKKKKIC